MEALDYRLVLEEYEQEMADVDRALAEELIGKVITLCAYQKACRVLPVKKINESLEG